MPQTSAVIVEKESSGTVDLMFGFATWRSLVTCGNFAVKQRGSNEENGLGNLLRMVRGHNFRTAKSS